MTKNNRDNGAQKKLTPEQIKNFRESFERWPGNLQRGITDDGEGFLSDACTRPLPCGCRVIGNGTIQFPLTVKQCDKHVGATSRRGFKQVC